MGDLGDCFVEATPGEVINEAEFSTSLRDGCEGGYPESGGGGGPLVGEIGRYDLLVPVRLARL